MAPTRLRLLREKAGLTQAELAAAAGLHQAEVSSVENGHARQKVLRRIAPILGEENPERLLERSWTLEEGA